jgi:hypothetical protein
LEFEKQFKESDKVSVVGFIEELLSRPTIEEKIKAVAGTEVISAEIYQEPETFIVPAFFDSRAFSDEAESLMIQGLVEKYQKIDAAIEGFLLSGYEESSYPVATARQQLCEVILHLRELGIEAELAPAQV